MQHRSGLSGRPEFFLFAAAAMIAVLWGTPGLTGEGDLIKSWLFDLPARGTRLSSDRGIPGFAASDGRRWQVVVADAGIGFEVIDDPSPEVKPPADGLPDGIVRTDAAGRAAWLTAPTSRYDHGVLGDAIEAGGLRLRLPDGRTFDFQLGDEDVFEDRFVRFWDVDGKGGDELVVVKSGRRGGGRIAVYHMQHGELMLMAESPAIGQAYRWLNPVGAADFDGDGNIEIAAVVTPHLGALLRLYRLDGARLTAVYEAQGFSNHAIGMRSLELAALADANGDGVSDIIVPNEARDSLRIVTFVCGKFRELGRVEHDAEIAGNLIGIKVQARPGVVYPLTDGTLAVAVFPLGQMTNSHP